MDAKVVREAASAHGVVPQALDTVAAKVRDHFAGDTPSPAAIASYIGTLSVWDKVGMTEQVFLSMPTTWRMEQARRFAPPPERRRPTTRVLTPEELAALDAEGLPRAEYIERARQLQQTPAP